VSGPWHHIRAVGWTRGFRTPRSPTRRRRGSIVGCLLDIRLFRTRTVDSFGPLAGLVAIVVIRLLHLDGALPAFFRLY
jgi:hypothetical protein